MEHGTSRMKAPDRIALIADDGTFKEINSYFKFQDVLGFVGYSEKVEEARKRTLMNEAVMTGDCKINQQPCMLVVMDSHFMMGSMGTIVGEKICRAFEHAIKKKIPVVTFTASGGARMQEGALSLFQMAKTSGAVFRHGQKKLLFITVITDPTTGGVSASFASQADIIIAEPKAIYGFTGKRIIEETEKKKLPEDFQSAEYALKNGAVDMIVERSELKGVIGNILKLHTN